MTIGTHPPADIDNRTIATIAILENSDGRKNYIHSEFRNFRDESKLILIPTASSLRRMQGGRVVSRSRISNLVPTIVLLYNQ